MRILSAVAENYAVKVNKTVKLPVGLLNETNDTKSEGMLQIWVIILCRFITMCDPISYFYVQD